MGCWLLQVDDEELRNMFTADLAMRSCSVLPAGTHLTLNRPVIDLLWHSCTETGKRYLES